MAETKGLPPPSASTSFYSGPSSTPVPDPTVLTGQAVAQAVEMLRRESEAIVRAADTRMDGIDRTVELIRANAAMLPERMDEKIDHLRDLSLATLDGRLGAVAQQIEALQRQIDSLQKQNEQAAQEAKEAVEKALESAQKLTDAQKDAAAAANEKTERNVNSLLDRLASQIGEGTRALTDKLDVTTKALDEKITSTNDRMTRFEGTASGAVANQINRREESGEHRAQSSATSSMIFAVIGVVGMVIGIVFGVVGMLR